MSTLTLLQISTVFYINYVITGLGKYGESSFLQRVQQFTSL